MPASNHRSFKDFRRDPDAVIKCHLLPLSPHTASLHPNRPVPTFSQELLDFSQERLHHHSFGTEQQHGNTAQALHKEKQKKKERSSKMLAHCVAFETLLMDFYMENKLIQAFLDIQISFKFCFHKRHSKAQAISLMQICKSTFGASTLFPPQRPCSQLFPLPSLTAAYQLLSTVFPNTV